MTLRLKINLMVGALTVLFMAVVIGLQLRSMRDSVHEEVVAANRVAAQLLNRTAWRYAEQGTPVMVAFLQGIGRVRSNDITLYDAQGQPRAGHYGLRWLAERVESLGGGLQIEPAAPRGALLRVQLPLTPLEPP